MIIFIILLILSLVLDFFNKSKHEIDLEIKKKEQIIAQKLPEEERAFETLIKEYDQETETVTWGVKNKA